MPEDVANGDQSVLHVVIDLARQVAHRDAPLGLAQPRRAGAQPLRHRAEHPGQGPDLVVARTREVHVQCLQVDPRRPVRQRGDGTRQARREPGRQQHRNGRGERQGREKPAIHVVTQRIEAGKGVGHDDPRRHQTRRLRRDRRQRHRPHDAAAGVGPAQRVECDGERGVPRELGQEQRVHRHTADESVALSAEPQRVDAHQREDRALRGAAVNQGQSPRPGQEPGEFGLQPIELVAEVAGAHDATIAILDLQEGQTREAHRRAGVVEQIGLLGPTPAECREAQAVVLGRRGGQLPQPSRDGVAACRQIGPNRGDRRLNLSLILHSQPGGDAAPDAQSKDDQWSHDDGSEADQQARTEGHLGITRIVPSASSASRGMPRRRTAELRVSISGTP